jgi:hypothetical protein
VSTEFMNEEDSTRISASDKGPWSPDRRNPIFASCVLTSGAILAFWCIRKIWHSGTVVDRRLFHRDSHD